MDRPHKRPTLTSTLGATSLATSITLFIHTLTIFNATRYIRLTYTTLAILLEIVATLLISIAITSTTTRNEPHATCRKKIKRNMMIVTERSKVYL
jgi:hypothetical protein